MSYEAIILIYSYLQEYDFNVSLGQHDGTSHPHFVAIVRKELPKHDVVARIIICEDREPGNVRVRIGAANKGSDDPHPAQSTHFETNYHRPDSLQSILKFLDLHKMRPQT
jgi:hypothetical protein